MSAPTESPHADAGGLIDPSTTAGWGQATSRAPALGVPLSDAVLEFLRREREDVGELRGRTAVRARMLDDGHPLSSYFISSSHNTYLSANQLTGDASASQYSFVLSRGCRCVEIDLWDDPSSAVGEPKVTHGYTLTERVTFRSVCEAIEGEVKEGDLPVVVSLECHAGLEGQGKAVEIMKEVFGEKLVTAPLEGLDGPPTINQLRGRVLIKVRPSLLHIPFLPLPSHLPTVPLNRAHRCAKVEYCPAGASLLASQTSALALKDPVDAEDDGNESDSSSDSSDDEAARELRKKRKDAKVRIGPALSGLGVYASSIKPGKRKWWEDRFDDPPHAVVNISESALGKLLSTSLVGIVETTAEQLIRVYPHGLRVGSRNLDPLPFWRCGSQIVALNWQRFDKGLQLSEALFAGTGGYVLKPTALRKNGREPPVKWSKVRVEMRVFGASNLPRPSSLDADDTLKPFLRAKLYSTTADVRHRTSTSAGSDPVWDSPTFAWEFDADDELAFLRVKVVHDVRWGGDEVFALWSARVAGLENGWTLIRLLDLKGRETDATVLVHFRTSYS